MSLGVFYVIFFYILLLKYSYGSVIYIGRWYRLYWISGYYLLLVIDYKDFSILSKIDINDEL